MQTTHNWWSDSCYCLFGCGMVSHAGLVHMLRSIYEPCSFLSCASCDCHFDVFFNTDYVCCELVGRKRKMNSCRLCLPSYNSPPIAEFTYWNCKSNRTEKRNCSLFPRDGNRIVGEVGKTEILARYITLDCVCRIKWHCTIFPIPFVFRFWINYIYFLCR
jgi:hypothetical protein